MRYAALFLLALAAHADEKEAEWIAHNIATPLKSGGIKTLDGFCTDAKLKTVAPYPRYVLQVCLAVREYVPARSKNKIWKQVVGFSMRLASEAKKLNPKDAAVGEAVGNAYLARARLLGNRDDFVRAVNYLEPVWKARKDEGSLTLLVDALVGAGASKRGRALAEAGAKAFPEAMFFRRAIVRGRLLHVRALLEKDREKGVLELQAVLREARELAERREEVAKLYNEMVTLGRRYNIATKYVTNPQIAVGDKLMFDLPYGTWTRHPGEPVLLRGPRGTIEIVRDVQSPPKQAAKARIYMLKTRLRDPKLLVKIKRSSLNSRIKKAFYFELGGLDKEGGYVRYRCWWFRGAEAAYGVEVAQTGPGADPEGDLIVASLRTTDRRR